VPSPIGHALGGAIVALAVDRDTNRTQALTFCMVAACLPDVDFLWGRHNMETHSVGFALIVGVMVFIWRQSTRLSIACALAVCTHVLFDWLGSDDRPPLGVMALWPFTTQFYFADVWLFDAISRQYWMPHFVPHNLTAVAKELLLLGIPALALTWWRRARARAR
jgi:membrane-bound metal-dependent hydrolase YbcI (DUF457 family)